MASEIIKKPYQEAEGGDWLAWIRLANGNHMRLQFGSYAYGVDEETANLIVAKVASLPVCGEEEESPCPSSS